MVQAVRWPFVLEAALVRGSDPFRFRAGSGALVQPASTSSKREASRPHPFFPQVCPDSVETRCTGYPPSFSAHKSCLPCLIFPLYFHAASIPSASVVILSHMHTQFIPTRESPSPDTFLACALGSLIGQDLMVGEREAP